MFRRSCGVVAPIHTFSITTLSLALVSVVSLAQDTQNASEPAAGFAPKAVVQTPADEGTLVDKVSYFIGFNVIKNAGAQANVGQLYEGMKAAQGPETKADFVEGYKAMTMILRQNKDADMAKVIEGMKAAAEGPDQKSFVIGHEMMTNFKEQGADFKLEKVLEGMTAADAGKALGMSDEETQALTQAFGKLIQQKQVEKLKRVSAENGAAGEAYMAKNAAENPSAKMLECGVQYQVLVEGTGPSPTPEDRVKIDYHGTFIDGTVFDSTTAPVRGGPPTPAELVVGQFVPGFSKTLQAMKVGSKWRVVIPGSQAYGMQGSSSIAPNQTLIFEVTLLEIMKK
ncbi:MAG: FKBP-type peptidyl-prolyl cis-trans isomerase [Mariniblastus sp.]